MGRQRRGPRACLACLALAAGACAKPGSAEPTPAGPRPAKVVVAEVKEGSVYRDWVFPAEVRARSRARLSAGAAGEITRIAVDVGDRVERGALLVEVDRDLALARLGVARARVAEATELLAQAERETGRLSGLGSGIVAEQEREQATSRRARATAELEAQRAEAQEARAQLRLHHIRAPFDGAVSDRSVDPGDWVKVGDPVVELVSLEGLQLFVDAGRALVGRIEPGTRAQLVGSDVPLLVEGVVPALDPGTRTLRLRLVPERPLAPTYVPGVEVEVAFSVELSAPNGVLVPPDAVLFDGARSRVVKAEDGKARLVEVEVSARSKDAVLVITEELSAGDRVLVRGNERVQPGQPLDVQD